MSKKSLDVQFYPEEKKSVIPECFLLDWMGFEAKKNRCCMKKYNKRV